MRIGTITFQCAHNYGAVLQAYALQETLKKMDHEVEVIDFKPPKIAAPYELKFITKPFSLKKFVTNTLTYGIRYEKYKKFNEFSKKYLKLTKKTYKTSKELNENFPNFDVCICGSDQVWNPEISTLEPYYLDFGKNKVGKISYAASFGVSQIQDKYKEKLKKYFAYIDEISVRETQGQNIIRELSDRESTHVLDPVFLLKDDEWVNIAKNSSVKGNYILVYSLEINSELMETAEKISEETGFKIIILNPTSNLKGIIASRIYKGKKIRNAGPLEYLSLIKNASYIITNSFHGTAFSIIMKKAFISIPHKTRNSRLESILEILDLKAQMLMEKTLSGKELIKKSEYDRDKTIFLLNKEIKKSINFLSNALEKLEKGLKNE